MLAAVPSRPARLAFSYGLAAMLMADASPTPAQSEILDFDGVAAGEELGSALADVGDLDGDGFTDVAVGSPKFSDLGLVEHGKVTLFSGRTGLALGPPITGSQSMDNLGASVAAVGDVNGDGIPDFAVGSPGFGAMDEGRVEIFSGANLAVPATLVLHFGAAGDRMGSAVAGPGDVNTDGFPDMFAGAPLADTAGGADAGRARVISANFLFGATLIELDGAAAGDQFGSAVAGPGDVNMDGTVDLMVGAPLADPNGMDSGRADVHGGNFGAPLLFSLTGDAAGDQLGAAVAGAGDVNGDGTPDVMAGAPLADDGALVDTGFVRLLSGPAGAMLFETPGAAAGEFLGTSVSSAADLDGN